NDWNIFTSMTRTRNGYYFAADINQLYDSPVFMGNFTGVSLTQGGTEFRVIAHSKNSMITAEQVAGAVGPVWSDARKFMGSFPMKRYYALYEFDDNQGGGALEHSQSAVFFHSESSLVDKLATLRSQTAHEFF